MKKMSSKKYIKYVPLVAVLGVLTVGAGEARADVSTVTVTVQAACSLYTNSGTGEAYNVSMVNGQYKDDIGVTTLTALCNNRESLSIYAVGYSNDTLGNTNMIPTSNTNSSATNIATGTATSGATSNWAMKVEAVTGAGLIAGVNNATPTIENNYNNFSPIPSQQTKVATLPSVTEAINSISVKSTYAIYTSPSQAPSTYTGKVKYTVVYPASNLPVGPIEATTGTISYSPNANGVLDTMGNQTIGDTDTEVTLWASNFKRAGYGFVGWSDKYDWVLNANDANGDGTGANVGYHIYGPNETIPITAGQYSGNNDGLSLYAVWAPSVGTLQGWTGCSSLPQGHITALTDSRDNNTYAVAKLADDKCWMVENMRLGGENAMTLTAADSNVTSDFTLSASTNPITTSWCTSDNSSCDDQSMLATNNTTNPVTNMTSATLGKTDSAGIYSMGNYYNWYSATAGTGTYSVSTNNTSVASSICPKGWRLPQGGNKTRIESNNDNDYWNLIVDALNNGVKPSNYSSSAYPYYNGATEAGPVDKLIRKYPNNYIHSGYVYGSSLGARGSYGRAWSSSAASSDYAYVLGFGSSYVVPGSTGGAHT